jgi:hypothetical protein
MAAYAAMTRRGSGMTKRNIDLSRDILIEIEKIDFSDGNAYFLSGVIDDIAEALNSSDVEYHFRLLEDNGFIRVAAPPPRVVMAA